MNTYGAVYLAVGVCVLLALRAYGRKASGAGLSLKTEMASNAPFDPGTWKYWLEVNFLGTVLPPILTVLGVVAWPGLIIFKVHDELTHRARHKREIFTVKRRDLICQMTVHEIERIEQVVDPLGAAPPVPFGFLNQAWQRFTADLEPTDAIWSFSKQWMNGSRKENCAGYALKRDQKIVRHFVISTSH